MKTENKYNLLALIAFENSDLGFLKGLPYDENSSISSLTDEAFFNLLFKGNTSFTSKDESSLLDDESEDFFFNQTGDDGDSGIVLAYKDSVVTISGLSNVKANELLYFDGGVSGVALNVEYNVVRALVFGGATSVRVTESVTRSNVVMQVGVGYNILGRIVDPLGTAIDGFGDIEYAEFRPIEKKAPGVITRKKINQPVQTGLKVVDSLVPIGRGQRELILGDRKTGKTTIAIDTILNQLESRKKFKEVISCIYVAIGKRMVEVVRIARLLRLHGAMSYTTLVVARASDPASLQFIAPYSACTMAEYFTYNGFHSLIIYDDLTRHADAYRQIALLLRRPVGREAYPGDIFYLHSRLLERAVKLSFAYGGGSLTSLPIVETIQGDVSAYIPTNVISITDGQIYLDLNRHQEGVRPAVDPGISVSRVGSSAQSKLMKKLSGSLKLELAQFREVEQFSKFGSELDATTRNLLLRGRTMVNLLKQGRNKPLSAYKVLMMFYISNTKIFKEYVAPSGRDVNEYFESVFSFLEVAIVFSPLKVAVESEAGLSIDREVFLAGLVEIHYSYYYNTEDFPLEPSSLYWTFNSGQYDTSIDSGLVLASTSDANFFEGDK